MHESSQCRSMRREIAGLFLLLAMTASSASSAPVAEVLADLSPAAFSWGSDPKYLGTIGGQAVFSISGEPNALVWITDGTPERTRPLEIWPRGGIYAPMISTLGTAGSHLFLLARGSGTDDEAILAIDAEGHVTTVLEAGDTWSFYYLDSPSSFRVAGRKLALALSGDFTQQSNLAFIDGDSLALEIAPAEPSGSVELLGVIGNELVFSRQEYGAPTATIWRSAGTVGESSAIASVPGSPFGDNAASAEGLVFFPVQGSGEVGVEAWATDLTPTGTVAVTSLADPGASIGRMIADSNRAYFVVEDATFGQELFVSNGRPSGTHAVTDFGFHQPFGSPDGTIVFSAHRAYFLATDGVTGLRLWLAGERPETTRSLVENVQWDSGSRWLEAAGGSVFVATSDELGVIRLMVSDGTEAGTHEVQTGCTEPCLLYVTPLTATASTFYFTGPSMASPVRTLYATRPPFQTATPLFEALKEGPAFDSVSYGGVAVVGEVVFFAAGQPVLDASITEEPWITAGTPSSTRMIRRLAPLYSSTEAGYFRTAAGALAFDVFLGYPNRILRRSSLDAEILEVPGEYGTCFYSKPFYALRDRFLFQDCSEEFWAFEPSGGPATVLLDSGETSYPRSAANDEIVGLLRWTGSDTEAWRVGDPATGATLAQTLVGDEGHGELVVAGQGFVLIHDLDWANQLVGLGDDLTRYETLSPVFEEIDGYIGSAELGRAFFTGYESTGEARVWTTDGTPSGTRAIFPSDGYAFAYDAIRSGSDWIVLATITVANTYELQVWRTDGTVAGSTALAAVPILDEPENSRLVELPGFFLFTSPTPNQYAELWAIPASGGTPTAILPSGVTLPRWDRPWSVIGGKLYFSACDTAHGCELWSTAGTPESTRLVQDIRPGAASSSPEQLLAVGNELVFTADDGLHGEEPWHLVVDASAPCHAGHGALCLDDGRFLARASWRAPVANVGDAGELPLTPDTGAFWFFDPDNIELIVKAIDGGGTNGHEWIFYGALSNVEYSLDVTDSQTGEARRYFNPAGRFASTGDILAFPSGAAEELTAVTSPASESVTSWAGAARREPAGASGSCSATENRFCILEGRFAVEATWRDFHGNTGTARAGALTDDTGYFWFFNGANVEIVVKAIDGSAYNGQFWIYFGALSNVEYTIRITDTVTATTREYRNPLGVFASFGDISAFPAALPPD